MQNYTIKFRYIDIVPELRLRDGDWEAAIVELLMILPGTTEWELIEEQYINEEEDRYIIVAASNGDEELILDKIDKYQKARHIE